MAAGIPDALFWDLAPREVEEWLKRRGEEEKAAYLRAGLVAAAVYNTRANRRKGAKTVLPGDFIRVRAQPEDYMNVDQSRAQLDAWARGLGGAEIKRDSPEGQRILAELEAKRAERRAAREKKGRVSE